jgi:NSS family neurotransmitter:Na+ symporter
VIGICLILGLPSSLGYSVWASVEIIGLQILDFFDFISNNIIMPVVALCTCLFVGYYLKPKSLIEEAQIGGEFKSKGLFTIMIRYIAPVCVLAILISSVLNVFGVIAI